MSIFNKFVCVLSLSVMLPVVSQAAIITFDFTGQFSIAGVDDPYGSLYTPIEASLTYDTESGVGSSDLSITMTESFFGNGAVTFHDITMARQSGTNLINGEMLVDWATNTNMTMLIEWDATGLFNAINYGLQAGDVLSGSDLYNDTNGNGVQDAGEFIMDISSATPHADTLQANLLNPQGSAPMAATANSIGAIDGPFIGIRGLVDIGSGNSMHVTSVSTVPIPAAVWLFGSGLISLVGFARRKKA